jgi:hypothetical protein
LDAEQKLKAQSLAVTDIAHRVLGLKTLDTQESDALDFHDLHIENIRAALNAAYEAGQLNKKPD